MAAGFVSVPVVPTFKGMSKEFSERLEKPAKASGERAGKAMSEGLGSGVENLERQVKASSAKLQDLDRAYEKSASKQAAQKEKVEAATLRLRDAEDKYQAALEKGDKGVAELAKVKEAKARVIGETEKLEQAEIDVRVAEQKHQDQLDDLNSTLGKLQDSQSGLNRELEKSGGAFGGMGQGFSSLKGNLSAVGPVMDSISSRLKGMVGLLGGAGLAGALKSTVTAGMDYELSMNTLQAVSGASADTMELAAKRARELGNDVSLPATSAASATDAMVELAKGGMDVAESMDAARGTIALAAAAQIDAGQAATIQAAALNTFSLEADQATRVADVLANTANASSAELTDVAEGMQQAGTVANQFGVSLEDTSAMLGMFANAGIKGSDAGTLMKTALLKLANQSAPAKGAIEELGLSIYDANGKFVGMRSLMEQLQEASGRMTDEQYQAATATLFGSDAMRLAGIAAEQGVEGFDKMRDSVSRSGAALDVAGAKMEGLPGAMEKLQNNVEELGLALYEEIKGPLEVVVKAASKAVDGLSSFWGLLLKIPGASQALTAVLVATAAAVAGLSAAMLGSVGVAALLNTAKGVMTGLSAANAAAFVAETAALEGVTLATAQATFAMKAFATAILTSPITWIAAAVVAAGAALWAFFTKTEVGRELWGKFVDALQSGWDWISGVFAAGWDWLSDKIGAFFGWFSDAFNGMKSILVDGDFTEAFANAFNVDEDSGLVDFLFRVRDAVQELWGFLQEKRDQLAAMLQPVIGILSGVMRDVVSSLGDTLGALWDSLKSIGESLGSALGSVAVSLFESLVSVIQSLWKAFQSLWEAVQPIGEFFLNLLLPVLKVVGAVIGGVVVGAVFLFIGALKVVAEVLAWVADKFAWLMENILGPFIEILGQVAAFIIETVVSAFTWLAEKVMAAFTTVLEWIGTFLTFLQENFWPVVEAIMGFVGDAFTALWDGLSWAWENVVQPVFNGIWELAQVTLAVIGTVILTPLLIAWNLLSSAIQWAWENVIQPVWQALANFAQEILWTTLQTVFQWIGDAWQWLSDKFSAVWGWIRDNVLNPMVDFFQNTLWPAIQSVLGWIADKWNWLSSILSTVWGWIRDNVIQLMINGFHLLWNTVSAVAGWISDKWNWLYGILLNIWNWLNENVIQRQIRGFHRIWEAVLSVAGWIADKWDWLKDAMHATFQWIDGNVFTPFRGALDRLKGFFGTVVDGIKTVWNGLKSALAAPINFMINTVYNDGIAKAWDTIGSFLPLKPKTATKLSPIGGYATGGAIHGPGSGTSDDIPAWLSNGEHVWTARDVLKAGGQQAVYAMRDAIQNGQAFSFDGNDLTLLPKHVDNKKGDLLGAAPSLFPAFKDGGEVRPMWELQLERAHKWAKSRSGRPYVLGGSADGAGGTDCSGFMSGIADVIGGGTGARQWATMAFNGGGNQQHPSGPQGFVAGLKAHTFSIGVTNGGAAGGHTAGTLGATSRIGAVNVESGGSPSLVKYGTGAVGANDSYFTTHYHLPIGPGGAFVVGKGSGGPSPEQMMNFILDKAKGAINHILNPIESMLPSGPPAWKEIPRGVYRAGKEVLPKGVKAGVDALGDGLSTVYEAASEVGDIVKSAGKSATEWAGEKLGLYDQGGWLPHGGFAQNLSGRPEPVFTASQWSRMSDMIRSLGDLVPAIEGQTKAIAKAVDDTEAWVSKTVGDMQDWMFKVGDYNSIEGITARQGVRRVLDLGIDLPGADVINTVLDGEDALWDSRARAAKNMENVAAKEDALQKARQSAGEAQQKLQNSSEEDRKKNAEEAAKANEEVAKAEQELAAARKQQAMDLDNIVLVSQEQVTGFIPMAEKFADQLVSLGVPAAAVGAGLAQFTGGLSAVAALIGPAGITLGMALDMVQIAISIVKAIVGAIKKAIAKVKELIGKIKEFIAKIRKARLDALKTLADGWAIGADYAKLVVDLQSRVTSLQQALIRGANEQREAEYNLMLAQHDRYIAEAEGALKVAEARLALDEEIRRGAVAAQLKMMGLHEDWDSYMAYQALEAQGVLEEWSDAAISALFTYEKARAEALKGEVSARLDQIKAEAALAEAQRQNVRNQQDLLKAQERLIRMSAQVAGIELEDATGTAEIAKLMAEMAEVKQAMDQNTLGRWGAAMGAKGSRANEYRGQKAHYDALQQALFAVAGATGANIDQGNLDRTLKLMGRAAYRGSDPMDVLRSRMPELAQAEMALRVNDALKPIYDARDQRDDLARKVEDFTAEVDLYEKTTPLEHTLKGLDYTIKSLEQSSEAWADGNEELRGEYLAAAKANRDAAEAAGVDWKLDSKYANAGVRDQLRRETTIHLDGEKMYTADQIDELLAEVTAGTNGSYKIVRSASDVAVSRRKERV
ncbi:phage tail tape measure protein [Corynebacterium sp. MSK158]|uniref:phage tail tape measure protein n=1 Tax=Corynebacterium sp. MSK158 TaxID=3050212 RepID=UPI00254AD3A3|nr:phage tail tape measure protein [Corynebacterium sp. MSK158]MDK8693576.1 phage tail tape measure protein [Corynebacterium sp. MSK158]